MKKLMSIAMAVCLMASMTVMASAVGSYDLSATGNKDVPIKVTYNSATTSEVIAVKFSAASLTFTYSEGSFTWNPDTLQYEGNTGKGWSEAQTFTVTSNSNVNLNVTTSIVETGDANGATMSIDKPGAQSLAEADDQGIKAGYTGNASSVQYTVTPGGTPTSAANGKTVANIHVVLAK